MFYRIALPILLVCWSPVLAAQDTGEVIEDVGQLTLELEREMGKDRLFSAFGLEVTSDGTVLVGDRERLVIEQFSPEGEYVGRVARDGNGPGEIPGFVGTGLINDTLFVERPGARLLHYYARNESGEYEYLESHIPPNRQRLFSIIGERSGSSYWALDETFYRNGEKYRELPVVITDRDLNVVADTVHLLRRSNSFFVQVPPNGFPLGGYLFSGNDRMKLFEDGRYVIGRPGDFRLDLYSPSGRMIRTIDLDIPRQPVEEGDLPELQEEWLELIKPHLAEYKPAYSGIWVSGEDILLRLYDSEGGRNFLLISTEGEILGTFRSPDRSTVMNYRNRRVYTGYTDPEGNVMVRAYRLTFDDTGGR